MPVFVDAECMTVEDVPADGNCLFHALSKRFELFGCSKTADEIRHELSSCVEDKDFAVSNTFGKILLYYYLMQCSSFFF